MPSSNRQHLATLLGLAVLALLAIPAAAGPVAEMQSGPAGLEWSPNVAYERLTLTVSGPEGFYQRQEFGAGEAPSFGLFDKAGNFLADGVYKYELRVTPPLSPAERESLLARRESGFSLRPQVESGWFSVAGGAFVPQDLAEAAAGGTGGPYLATRATVLTNADGVIRNSLCVGFDCPNNPSFSDTTILMMENNTRIKFDDTSNTASFPNNDWEIEANSNLNGGANYLGVNDCGNSSQGGCATDLVFAIESGVRSSALYVESDGDVGFGTSNPVVTLHAVDGNTPTLRLDQDGSSGFTPQVWDVAGNETNFFIRDATGGSQLPFRIQPGADSNSIFIESTNDVGVGTSSPSASLHVRRTSGSAQLFVEEASGTEAVRTLMQLTNNGRVRWQMTDTSGNGQTWTFFSSEDNFNISSDSTAGQEFVLTGGGDLTLTGDIFTSSCSPCVSDYVFEPNYELMPLDEVAAFIKENQHLPNIPSESDYQEKGRVGLHDLQVKLLEKIEELTLYTLGQHGEIADLRAQNAELQARLGALEAALQGPQE